MNLYFAYNATLAAIVLPSAYFVLERQTRCADLLLSARIALQVTLIGYPWDFFAVRLGVWTYPRDPGIGVYGVPVNDLLFIWLGTYFSSSLLLGLGRRQARRECHTEREYARQKST